MKLGVFWIDEGVKGFLIRLLAIRGDCCAFERRVGDVHF